MPFLHRRFVPAIVLAVLSAAPLRAQVVVEGGAPNGQVGWEIFNDTRLATAFTVGPSGVAFDGIRFWGIFADGGTYSPDIYWQVLADAGGAPDDGSIAAEGHALAVGTNVIALASAPGYSAWQFDLTTGSQSIGAGTFWLALHDGIPDPTGASLTNVDFYWEATSAGTPYMSESISAGLGWGQQGDTGLAFELLGAGQVTATPEPASLLLFATGAFGLAGVGVARRRIRRRKTE